MKVTKSDGTDITKAEVKTDFINNIFHSLFQTFSATVTDSAYDTVVIKSLDDPGNTLTRRTNWFFDNLDNSDTFHDLVLFDKLMVTPFTQEKLLPYGIELFLTLERATSAFYLMASSANTATAANIEIKGIKLHVPYVKLSYPEPGNW